MSVRQGNNIIAGGNEIDPTPTSGSSNPVASGGVYTALTGKVNTGHQVIDFQEPTAENRYTWYRKYADGWVEQGGVYDTSSGTSGVLTISLPIAMLDTNYTIGVSVFSYNNNNACIVNTRTPSTTNFIVATKDHNGGSYGNKGFWQVSGLSAN